MAALRRGGIVQLQHMAHLPDIGGGIDRHDPPNRFDR
jgi:hypothetical protein